MAGTIHRPEAEAQKLPPALRRVSKTDVGGAASFATLLEAANIQVDPKLRDRPVVAADVADERQDHGTENDSADVADAPVADERDDQADEPTAAADEVTVSAAANAAAGALKLPVAAAKPVVADDAPKSAAPAATTDDNAGQADQADAHEELAADAATAPEMTLDPAALSDDTALPVAPAADALDLSSFETATLAAAPAADTHSAAPSSTSPTAIKTIDLSTAPVAPMAAAAPAQPISDLAAPDDPAAATDADGPASAAVSTASKADAPVQATQPSTATNAIAAAPVAVAPAATVTAAAEGASTGAVAATTSAGSARGGQTGTQSQTTTQQGNQNAVAGTETARGERAAKNQAAQQPRFSKVLQERQADIARQVARAIGLRAAMRTDSKISLLLNPASLGALKINVSFDGAGKISVDAQTEQAATRHLLAGAAEELRTALRSVDIELSRFSVDQQSGGNAWLMNDAKSGFGADGRGQQGADGRTAIGDASARRRENETDELAEASGPLTMGGVDLSA
jgi:hypothetical protein